MEPCVHGHQHHTGHRDISALGSDLLVTGFLDSLNGQIRIGAARISQADGSLHAFGPVFESHLTTHVLSGGMVILGGYAGDLNGYSNRTIGAVDPATGYSVPWSVSMDIAVRTLCHHGDRIFVGGHFTTVNGKPRRSFACIRTEHSLDAVGQNSICVDGNATLQIPISCTGTFGASNVFTVQLLSPIPNSGTVITIGTQAATGNTTVTCTIPENIPPGAGYRLRITSSDPEMVGPESDPPFSLTAPWPWYADQDGDGHGDPGTVTWSCVQPEETVANDLDCDDSDPEVYPGAECDDGDPVTVNDVWTLDCTCVGDISAAVTLMDGREAIRAWPNPARDLLHLSAPVSGTIHNVHGQVILHIANTQVIQLSDLRSGVYLLRMDDGALLRFIREQ
jgi:hypothetical protein